MRDLSTLFIGLGLILASLVNISQTSQIKDLKSRVHILEAQMEHSNER